MELFKVLKLQSPIEIYNLIRKSSRTENLLLMPSVNLDISKQNFVFKSTQIWNKLTKILFINCLPHTSGIVIPGSTKYSDMTTPICVFKNKIKNHILYTQKLGYAEIWAMENVLHCN